jgi:hypothetical protein
VLKKTRFWIRLKLKHYEYSKEDSIYHKRIKR